MKYWSLIVATLYTLVLLVLMAPLVLFAFGHITRFSEVQEVLSTWQTWLIVFLMFAAQFALLRVPVQMANCRPVSQRPVIFTIAAAGFAMALLIIGTSLSIYEFATQLKSIHGLWISLTLGMGSWVFWSVYFHRASKRVELDAKLSHIRKHLMAGSILELLVAVPTHIVARHRDYCCAGLMTFLGLAAGVSVMLFAFGPAVYFLFVERWKRLHPAQARA